MTDTEFRVVRNIREMVSNGSCYQGDINTTFDHISSVFGRPSIIDGDKMTVEWIIQFKDGTVATIYDWKTNYTPLEHYDWHIGGFSSKSVELITKTLSLSPNCI